uniref:Putative endonuclease/reverse transcriptase n=1 Tax=Amblyomma tuberculatum TaxID=48802 RepID=A0A6M2E323_9ACAR
MWPAFCDFFLIVYILRFQWVLSDGIEYSCRRLSSSPFSSMWYHNSIMELYQLAQFSSLCQRTASVTNMKAYLRLPLLSTRTKLSRLCLFHKIYYHNSTLYLIWIQPPSYISFRRNHSRKVHISRSNMIR